MTSLRSSGVPGRSRVLIIEDEATLAGLLAENLMDESYEVEVAADGLSGMDSWAGGSPDVVVLDVMLPHLDGFEVCRRMRGAGDETPVLFLSARAEPVDRVAGLSVGGDDYLTKPFHLPEFLLRVSNLLKRRERGQADPTAQEVLDFGGHRVDLRSHVAVLADDRSVELGARELKILELLAMRANEVVSRDTILDHVWGREAFPSSRTVDNFIVKLRRLFEPEPSHPRYFHTVWGVGYRFTPDG